MCRPIRNLCWIRAILVLGVTVSAHLFAEPPLLLPQPGVFPATAARPHLGSGNNNPLSPSANRSYGKMTERMRDLFSQLTLLPSDSFDIVWDPAGRPQHY